MGHGLAARWRFWQPFLWGFNTAATAVIALLWGGIAWLENTYPNLKELDSIGLASRTAVPWWILIISVVGCALTAETVYRIFSGQFVSYNDLTDTQVVTGARSIAGQWESETARFNAERERVPAWNGSALQDMRRRQSRVHRADFGSRIALIDKQLRRRLGRLPRRWTEPLSPFVLDDLARELENRIPPPKNP